MPSWLTNFVLVFACGWPLSSVMRSQLPTLELDAVFEAKEDLALAVKNALAQVMSGYGYSIIQALITDLDPDEKVKAAMNEINSSKRLKYAVAERAEGEKILEVKRAEVSDIKNKTEPPPKCLLFMTTVYHSSCF